MSEVLLLTPAQAGTRYGFSERTLESWRHRGEGPAYIKAGRLVRYSVTDFEQWLNRCAVRPANDLMVMPATEPRPAA
jgi:hypothetical protein